MKWKILKQTYAKYSASGWEGSLEHFLTILTICIQFTDILLYTEWFSLVYI